MTFVSKVIFLPCEIQRRVIFFTLAVYFDHSLDLLDFCYCLSSKLVFGEIIEELYTNYVTHRVVSRELHELRFSC